MSEKITVTAQVNAPIEKVWKSWTEPYHIMNWNHANDDWHTTRATNDLRQGGKFTAHMAAKDKSFGFDFEGVYDAVVPETLVSYTMADGRTVEITFKEPVGGTLVSESFDPESTNPADLQRQGWQAILNNFKKYTEDLWKGRNYSIYIEATPDKVSEIMTDPEKYRIWTNPFNEGSFFRGTWEEGTKILFIGADQNGNEAGMVSRIKANQKGRYISIEHYGEYKNGEEITTGPEVEKWAGSLENYTFLPESTGTRVLVEMTGGIDGYAEYFDATWPKALEVLKSICE